MPLLLLVLTIVSVTWHSRGGETLSALASLILAVLFAWRLSFHATMWEVTEYGGIYTSDIDMRTARRRYRKWVIASIVVALAVVIFCLRCFG